jgi:hypothetical protein
MPERAPLYNTSLSIKGTLCYIEVTFIDSDLLYRGTLYRLICYIEVPFIDSDVLYRGDLYTVICYIEVPFIDSDVLYRGALSGMFAPRHEQKKKQLNQTCPKIT